jgi:hypothetical protein
MAEVDVLLLVTFAYAAPGKQFALFMATAPALFRGEIVKHGLKIRVFFEDGIVKQRHKAFGVNIEIAQFIFKLQAVIADVAIHMRKAFLTTQAARG